MATQGSDHSAGRVVLITGASSGIGEACAKHLAARGWRVFGTGRGNFDGSPTGGVEMVTMDVDNDASVAQGVASVLAKTDRLDAVVNNAGFALSGAVEDTSIEEAKAQLETNFFGVLRVCRATLPALRKQAGTIVNISSLAGIFGLPFNGMYSASKFALEGMSESLRQEVRPWGVRVVLVEPGDFRTQITARRRFTAQSSTSDTYAATFKRFSLKQDQDEAAAPEPPAVALLVERILNTPNPKMRYAVGMFSQTMVVPLKRYLPERLYEFLLRRVLGV